MSNATANAASLTLHTLFLDISSRSANRRQPAAEEQARIYQLLFNGPGSPVAGMVRRYLATCPGFRRYLQSTTEELDLCHDIYLALIRALQRGAYQGHTENPHGFVKTIAVRQIRGLGRRAQTRWQQRAHVNPEGDGDPLERVVDCSQSPAADLDRQQISQSIDWVTARLATTDRYILWARYVEELSHSEIARRAGKPSSSASRVGLMRAQKRARKLFESHPRMLMNLHGALSRVGESVA